jgi:sugar lactone lactonase YvrE
VVATFDPAMFELPEGLAILDDDAYVGFALTGAIDRFDLPEATRTMYANAPQPPPNTAFMTGLTFDPDGQLYAAYVSFAPDATPGVYRAAAGGGAATLWATHQQMVFPNGFAWDDDGLLYVTDSAAGGIFRIDANGTAELWLTDAQLEGDPLVCGGMASDIAVGANGIVFLDGSFYVASSDQALLARVPLEADGSAGTLEVIAGPDCDELAGIDGLTLDGTDILAAINRSNRILRIASSDGATEALAEGAPLDFPASLEFAGQGADRALYVTSFALGAFLSGGDPAPALVRIGL